jgi:hypothetical protein
MARFFDGAVGEGYEWNGDGRDWGNIDHTISAWVKLDTLATSGYIFGISAGATTRIRLQIYSASRRLQYWDFYATTGKYRIGNTILNTAQWYHVAATNDVSDTTASTSIKVYLDGTEEAYFSSVNGTGPQPTDNDDWVIGIEDGGGSNEFDGDIAEVGLWERILSDSEIAALATGAAPNMMINGLAGYYSLRRNVYEMMGQGAPVTTRGTPDVTDHPPGIYYPSNMLTLGRTAGAAPAAGPFLPVIAFGANV